MLVRNYQAEIIIVKYPIQGRNTRRVARNSQWGGGLFWGSGGKAPSRWRHGGRQAEPPALENLVFFCKNNFILGLFWLKKKKLLKRGLEIGRANMIKLVA